MSVGVGEKEGGREGGREGRAHRNTLPSTRGAGWWNAIEAIAPAVYGPMPDKGREGGREGGREEGRERGVGIREEGRERGREGRRTYQEWRAALEVSAGVHLLMRS